MSLGCPFCAIAPTEYFASSEFAIAFYDRYPISPEHTLVIPRRHVASIFELSVSELGDLWQLVAKVRIQLIATTNVFSFNIGVNDGMAAGQTVMHAHIHVIPRRSGDVIDPRGGVRWVIPEKARYW
ncbi:MAG TPA: HIT family protein [Planctomycetaceae bacterium]|nr:HIT family protein [Planctomycetaceae bacterium]